MILDHCNRASCAQIIEALRAELEELSKERDLALSYGDRMGGQLVLARVRIKVLREALKYSRPYCHSTSLTIIDEALAAIKQWKEQT